MPMLWRQSTPTELKLRQSSVSHKRAVVLLSIWAARLNLLSVCVAPPDSTQVVLQGYMLKLGGLFNRAWQSRYFYLMPDRLDWLVERLQPVKNSIPVSHITGVSETIYKQMRCLQIVTTSKTYLLRSEAESDLEVWFDCLKLVMQGKYRPESSIRRQEHSTQSVYLDDFQIGDVLAAETSQREREDLSAPQSPASQPAKHARPSKAEGISKPKDKKPGQSQDSSVADTSSGGDVEE
eukprot:m.255896 g.255896  ORF g.255896 m.255896 type:complete len:236 (+) comp54546_c1_seq14:1802-2509(+)